MFIKRPGYNFLRAPDAEGAGAGADAGAAAASATAGAAAAQGADKGAAGADAKGGQQQQGDAKGGQQAQGDAKGGSDQGAKKADTIMGGGAAADKGQQTPADWPTDWRAKLAGDDKTLMTQLERYASPVELAKKLREQDILIAQGAHKKPFPKDGKPEDQAAWRKENSIPEAADKYDIKLPDGLVIGEDDKPIVEGVMKALHGVNATNEQVNAAMAEYYRQEAAYLQTRATEIISNKKKADDALHAEWGGEYRQNVNSVDALGGTFSRECQAAIAGAVDSDGMPLLNNPSFIKEMLRMARTMNPADIVPGSGGGTQAAGVDQRIKDIETKMGTPEYYKDEKLQAEYRELVGWRERNADKK